VVWCRVCIKEKVGFETRFSDCLLLGVHCISSKFFYFVG
jgi:hypothetical protein